MTPLRLERDGDGALAVLTIDHPPLNLFDRAMFDALENAVDELEQDPPRGLLLRAEGRVVSGGVDVGEFQGLTPQTGGRLWRELLATVQRIEALPYPTVFAAHGLTLTAAFEVSLACDLIVAARSARFGLVEAVVGLTPSMGGTQRLAARAGHGRARQFVMTGDLFDADTLERWGVLAQVWDDDQLDARARKLAQRLANGPTVAHAATKAILRAYAEGGVAAADALVPVAGGSVFGTQDTANAVRTFLDEGPGKATFEGR